ncbi:hypothetical protein DQ04_02281030 [Trypanosoma grayi]|uniref:hypothetical protein n=1 Tax=Trypanosoma grayi TaxID=71804 RepID=UPI0004F443BE|nr:hypothetical protein DQ04_02281030 [Trypanosoma grayi]KEG11785.1 hypothetical protein DQ04_02281030 [Trypanosoma grayi]
MGKFLLCVESNVREVNNLLAFHNVHPQVRADVQRRLQRLLHRLYDHVDTLAPGYGESAQDVCSTIVHDVVHNTIHNVIPLVELAAEEKRRAALEQRTRDLAAELQESERRCREMEAAHERVRQAHEFMLHCYFREVLVLRYQLQEAVAKSRRLQGYASQASLGRKAPPPTSSKRPSDAMEPLPLATAHPLAPFSTDFFAEESISSPTVYVVATTLSPGALVAASPPPERAATAMPLPPPPLSAEGAAAETEPSTGAKATETPTVTLTDLMPLKATMTPSMVPAAATADVPTTVLKVTVTDPAVVASPTTGMTTPTTVTVKTAKSSVMEETTETTALTSITDDEDVRLKVMVRPTKVASTQTTFNVGNESVDAIFDYEQYIRLLNAGWEGESSGASEGCGLSPEKLTLDKRRREEVSALRFMQQQLMRSQEATIASLQAKLQEDETFAKAASWRTALVLRPIKEILLEELSGIHSGVQRMRAQHLEDMTVLQQAMKVIQARIDFLLAFFLTYSEEVGNLAVALSADTDVSMSCKSHLLSSEDDPCQRRVVLDYFADTLPFASSVASDMQDDDADATEANGWSYHREGAFWENNPVTLQAKRAFAALQAAVFKARDRRGRRTRRATNALSTTFVENSIGGFYNAEDDEEDDAVLGDDDMGRLAALSHEDRLKALVRLRMQRIAYRARHRNRLRQLAEDARRGRSADELQRTLYEAWMHEQRVARITRAINRLLRQMGFSASTSKDERAFFTKNLALSPYLYDPAGAQATEDVVYVPVPVRAEHAGDLCATLASNQPGYVVFNGEIVPIATVTYCSSSGLPLTKGAAAGRVGSRGKDQRRVAPFHGAVVDYQRGVQLGRPLGDKHGPLYVFYDPDEHSFLLVEEREARSRVVGRVQERQQPQPQQPQQRQNVRLATILMPPPLPEVGPSETPMPTPPPTIPAPAMIAPKERPPCEATFALTETTPTIFPPVQQPIKGLPSRVVSERAKNHPCRLAVIQPNEEDRDLMRVESLSARRDAAGKGPGGVMAFPPTSSSSTERFVTALERLKGDQRRRKETTKERNTKSLLATNRRFSSMRFPRILTPSPSPSE